MKRRMKSHRRINGQRRRCDAACGRVRRLESTGEGSLHSVPARERREGGGAGPFCSKYSVIASVRSLPFALQFHQRPSDKSFVANVRLMKPPPADIDTQGSCNQDLGDEDCVDSDPLDKRLAAVPEALRAYANLIFLVIDPSLVSWTLSKMLTAWSPQIGERPTRSSADRGTYVKETRLVRFINEVYDARYEDLSASCMDSCGSVRAS